MSLIPSVLIAKCECYYSRVNTVTQEGLPDTRGRTRPRNSRSSTRRPFLVCLDFRATNCAFPMLTAGIAVSPQSKLHHKTASARLFRKTSVLPDC